MFFERCIVSEFVFASLLPTNFLVRPVITSTVLTMSGPSKRSLEEEEGWKNKPRKKKKTRSKHERNKARAMAGIAKKDNAEINVDVPNGLVNGDRSFCKDLEKKKCLYCNIENGTHGIWRDIDYDGVQWGDGEGGVWVYNKRAAIDVHAWEVLKMNEGRLEALHIRNLSRLKARLKPVKLPLFFEKLVEECDLKRLGEDEAKAAVDTEHADKERAIAQRVEVAGESIELESVSEAAELLRAARDEAVAEAETMAAENRLLILEIREFNDSSNVDLRAKLADHDEKLHQAEAEVERMKAATAKRLAECTEFEKSSERYKLTFGVEDAATHCVDDDSDVDLPPVLNSIRSSVKYPTWAGWTEEGHSTSWPAPALARLLDLRCR